MIRTIAPEHMLSELFPPTPKPTKRNALGVPCGTFTKPKDMSRAAQERRKKQAASKKARKINHKK